MEWEDQCEAITRKGIQCINPHEIEFEGTKLCWRHYSFICYEPTGPKTIWTINGKQVTGKSHKQQDDERQARLKAHTDAIWEEHDKKMQEHRDDLRRFVQNLNRMRRQLGLPEAELPGPYIPHSIRTVKKVMIEALERKAASTSFPGEAESFRARAKELRTKYEIGD